MTRRRTAAAALVAWLALSACGTAEGPTTAQPSGAPAPTVVAWPAPAAPEREAHAATDAFDALVDEIVAGTFDTADVVAFADAGDARHAWLLSDLLRFVADEVVVDTIVEAFDRLTGTSLAGEPALGREWRTTADLLIGWDTPAPPDYRRLKGRLFVLVEPRWAPFFDDHDATIDDRWLSWGGVFIDDRPLGTDTRCPTPGCIPALDDPELVRAGDGGWYDDAAIVFGVVEQGEAVAFPKNIMEVHELVNITIGGRRFGIPYCTLCGSAQAFYTDEVPAGVETPVLRTSGLLNRSNKVMYDLVTFSAFDTFTGEAVSGPLLDAGVMLPQTTVTVTTWGAWRERHPDTSIVAEDGGIGRTYPDDPLRGRDDDGPIFPIGDVDRRLGVQDVVVGIVRDDGTAIAFSVAALDASGVDAEGDVVAELGDVRIVRHAGGYRAQTGDLMLPSHQAFWFAWSQFHPGTLLWPDQP